MNTAVPCESRITLTFRRLEGEHIRRKLLIFRKLRPHVLWGRLTRRAARMEIAVLGTAEEIVRAVRLCCAEGIKVKRMKCVGGSSACSLFTREAEALRRSPWPTRGGDHANGKARVSGRG